MRTVIVSLLLSLVVVPLFAFTPVITSNASQNAGTVRAVMEPVISVMSLNGVTHGNVAYINFPNAVSAPYSAQIQVAHTYDFVNWSAPVTLPLTATNGITYQNSADPVFVEYGPYLAFYTNWLWCFGTMWTNTDSRGQSAIAAWHSADGGLTWSQPEAIDVAPYDSSCELNGTCIFEDKPAVAMSPDSGVIYVAFTRETTNPVVNNQVYMTELNPSRGWINVGRIGDANMPSFPGPTPVVDPTTNMKYVFVMDRPNQTIRTFASGDGWIWNELEVAPAPGIFMSAVIAGTNAGSPVFVQAEPFISAKFDAFYHYIDVTYHRQDPGGAAHAIYRRFVPFSHVWTGEFVLNGNGHTQWNPTINQLSNGNFVFTYYDYTPGDAGYTLYATRVDLYGQSAETTRIFPSALSLPAGYNVDPANGLSRIGEYQGLAVFNDQLYAATTYIPQSNVGNAWMVKFTTP